MARQRFIWPSIWEDPELGHVSPLAFILYVGCFSNADDHGKLRGDPLYLKGVVFRYRNLATSKVKALRDELEAACREFVVYSVSEQEYIVFRNWGEFQKPKYPKDSVIPDPEFPEGSGNPSLWVGLGRDGLDGVGLDSNKQTVYLRPELAVEKLLKSLKDKDENTREVVARLCNRYRLSEGDIMWALECSQGPGVESPTRVAVAELKKRGEGRQAA